MAGRKARTGGSFGELRRKHLPLFDRSLHRHDRGWPHPAPEKSEPQTERPRWETAGIAHFRHPDGGES